MVKDSKKVKLILPNISNIINLIKNPLCPNTSNILTLIKQNHYIQNIIDYQHVIHVKILHELFYTFFTVGL